MNDFTKEELQIIWLELNTSIIRHKELLIVAPSFLALKNKVESMIDGYCEHSWNNSYCGCAVTNFDCNNCGVILNESQKNV